MKSLGIRLESLVLPSILILVLLGAAGPAGANEAVKPLPRDPLRELFQQVEPLEALQVGPLTVVPLRASSKAQVTDVLGHPTLVTARVVSASRKKPTVELYNPTKSTVLITAGRVAYSENADVIVAHDIVLPPDARRTVRAIPGSFRLGALNAGDRLNWYPRWAPPSLREAIVTDASSYDVKTYLALFHDVAGSGTDRIPTLRDVLSSDFAGTLDVVIATAMHNQRLRADDVVGFVVGVYGRPVSLQLFGSSALHRKLASKLLESHGIYAAVLKQRARDLGIPIRTGDDARAAVQKATNEVLERLRGSGVRRASIDRSASFWTFGLRGTSVWREGKPVHVAGYFHDPYRRSLFARAFTKDAPQAPSDDGQAETPGGAGPR